MVAQVRYSMAGLSRGRVAPCAVCIVHVETRNACFFIEPQNQGRRFVSSLASRPLGQFLRFGLKTGGDGFFVEPQNQGGEGFSDLGLKIGIYGLVIYASKSLRQFPGLVHKTKQTLVCWLHHKTDGSATVWDTCRDVVTCFSWKEVWLEFPSLASRLTEARRRVVHVASSLRLH
jgi:hypothetical protein